MKEPSDFPAQFRRQVRPGTRLNGIYEIDALIATGGMGEVYSGRAIETGIKVAIKMVRADLTESETVLALFRKEAAALHNLQHEAIVRYYVFTTDPDLQCPYLAMELVEGASLSSLIVAGPLPPEHLPILKRRIGSALDAAHRAGIVHRDLSPDNVILPDGDPSRAKLIDFGIARSAFGGGTVIGDRFAGKANYASPEQVGLYGGVAGPKSDIYSFGLTLAAAALGEPLKMGGTQLEIVRKRQKVPDLRQVDPSLRPLLAHMLQPKPEDRPASMAEIAAWEPSGSRLGTRSPAGGRRRWLLPTLAGAGLALSAGGGFFASRYLDDDAQQPAPAEIASRAVPGVGQAILPPARPGDTSPAVSDEASRPPPVAETPPRDAGLASAALPPPVPAAPFADPAPARPQPEAPPAARTAGAGLPPGVARDCADCPQLVAVRGGRFRMGSTADPTERPAREVAVAAFMAGRFPVTGAEWRACFADRACAFDPGGDPDEPVRNVSWDDAQAYLAWLSRLSGFRYRLLTEAEWEYAARGGTATRYWWGESFRPDLSPCRSCAKPALRSPPEAGSFPANPFGLHGVTGSVNQWTADCWHKDYRGAPKDASAWLDAQPCRERVLRGGAWNSDENGLRVSSREFYDASVRYPNHGFRVARDM